MAAFVVTARTILLGTAWTGTAPGPTIVTPAGTISTPSDISGYVVSGGEPSWTAAMIDVTNMGSLGYTSVIPGITTGDDLVFDCNADETALALGVIVRTTLGGIARPGSVPIYFDIKPTVAARSATNPSFVGAAYIKKWQPRNGAVGARAVSQLVLGITGTVLDLVV
jgi:hypothetical protein